MVTQTSAFAALAVDPSHPANSLCGSLDRGLFKSGDGGRNWKVITTGADFGYVEDVLVDPSNSTVIYVSTVVAKFSGARIREGTGLAPMPGFR